MSKVHFWPLFDSNAGHWRRQFEIGEARTSPRTTTTTLGKKKKKQSPQSNRTEINRDDSIKSSRMRGYFFPLHLARSSETPTGLAYLGPTIDRHWFRFRIPKVDRHLGQFSIRCWVLCYNLEILITTQISRNGENRQYWLNGGVSFNKPWGYTKSWLHLAGLGREEKNAFSAIWGIWFNWTELRKSR